MAPRFILDKPNLDALAWRAICEWPRSAVEDFTFAGLDFTLITRWFLWDKVGRAIRREAFHEAWAFEESFREQAVRDANQLPLMPRKSAGLRDRFTGFLSKLIRSGIRQSEASGFQRADGKIIYAPVISSRLAAATAALIRRGRYQVLSSHFNVECKGVSLFQATMSLHQNMEFTDWLVRGIGTGLESFGIQLEESDTGMLRQQVGELTATVQRARQELELLRPAALLIHADNHPPFQPYVLVARQMNIPSVMLQHGLDCERYYLDDAYASHVAVWGPERAHRYQVNSAWQPRIQVTGNPEYDQLKIPGSIDASGSTWLWATRPHTPEKCYAPTRDPREGLAILDALLAALRRRPDARLLIKPHPYDYGNLYSQKILAERMQGQVKLVVDDLWRYFANASVVITEDSTAGLESMFLGKPLVHAHFCSNRPTMPFVDYGAALPGFSTDELADSLQMASDLDTNDKVRLLAGQKNFLADFAGPCDGLASERITDFIDSVIDMKN